MFVPVLLSASSCHCVTQTGKFYATVYWIRYKILGKSFEPKNIVVEKVYFSL